MLLNFAVFQLAWFAAVLGAANAMPWAGPLGIGIAIALHLTASRRALPELLLILCCGAIGAVFDSLLVAADWVSYPNGMVVGYAAPYWIVAMWMLFATTLNVSLKWLKPRKGLSILFGLVGGPLAYFSGAKLGAIVLNAELPALLALGFGWALKVPALLLLAERLDGYADPANDRDPALIAQN